MHLVDKKAYFKQSLFADTLRGADSTGVAFIDKDNSPFIYKKAIAGSDFVDLRTFDRMSFRIDPKVAMGHNRAATRGGISADTAHPFYHGNVILAHNGTLTNHTSLTDGRDFSVDSEYIAYSFSEFGVEATLKLIRGAFALTWYDTETGLFNVCRNDERELCYAIDTKKNTMLYASEGGMLNWLAEKNDFTLDNGWYYEFDAGKWYTINPANLDIQSTEVDFAPKIVNNWQRGKGYTPNRGNTSSTLGTPTSTYKKQSTFTTALGKLGLELDEEIILNFIRKEMNGTYLLQLAEWYAIEPEQRVIIHHFYCNDAVIDGNEDKYFKARIRGCTNVDKGNHFEIYINQLSLVEGPEEKKLKEEAAEFCFPGPNSSKISMVSWDRLTRYGCDSCGGNINFIDAYDIKWTISGTPICAECLTYHYMDYDSDLQSVLEYE